MMSMICFIHIFQREKLSFNEMFTIISGLSEAIIKTLKQKIKEGYDEAEKY